MKVLGISCSPRKKGNTVILLEEMLRRAAEHGAEGFKYSERFKPSVVFKSKLRPNFK